MNRAPEGCGFYNQQGFFFKLSVLKFQDASVDKMEKVTLFDCYTGKRERRREFSSVI